VEVFITRQQNIKGNNFMNERETAWNRRERGSRTAGAVCRIPR